MRWHTGRPVENRPSQEQLELEDMTLEQVLPHASSDSVPLYKQLVELSQAKDGLTRKWIEHILAQFDSFCQRVLVKSRFELWDEPYRIRDEYNALYKDSTEAKSLPILIVVARILTFGELLRQVHFASIETTLLRTPPKELLRVEQPLSDVTPHDFFGNELITSTRTDRYPSNRWGIYTDLSRPLQPQVMACCYQPADDSPGCWISLMGDSQPFGLSLQYTLVTRDYWQELAENKMTATQLAVAFQKDFQVGTAFLNVNRFEKLHEIIQSQLADFATMLQKAYIAYIAELDEAIVDETPLPLSPSLSLSSMDFLLAKSMMMLLFQYNEPHNVTYPSGNELSWMDTHFFKTAGVVQHWTVNNRGGLWSDDNSRMLPFLQQVDWNNINVKLYDNAIDVLNKKILFQNLMKVRAVMLTKVWNLKFALTDASKDIDNMKNARELLSYNNSEAATYLDQVNDFRVQFAAKVSNLNSLISNARKDEITTDEIRAVSEATYPDKPSDFAKLLTQAKKEKRIEDAGKAVFNGVVTTSLPLVTSVSNYVKTAHADQKALFDAALPVYQSAVDAQKHPNGFPDSQAALDTYKQEASATQTRLGEALQVIQTNILRLNEVASVLDATDDLSPKFLLKVNLSDKEIARQKDLLKKLEDLWKKAQREAEAARERLRLEEEARKKAAAVEAERLAKEKAAAEAAALKAIRTITIPNPEQYAFTIKTPPRAGPSFYQDKLQWEANSCWMDAVFTALFSYPGNAYSQSIINAVTVNGSGKCMNDSDFIDIHSAICGDIKQLSTPLLDASQKCPLDARVKWAKCVQDSVPDQAFGRVDDVIGSLQALYGNTHLSFQDDGAVPSDVSDKTMFLVRSDAPFAYSGERPDIQGTLTFGGNAFVLTGVILNQINTHFICALRDLYESNDWWIINYKSNFNETTGTYNEANSIRRLDAKESPLDPFVTADSKGNSITFEPQYYVYLRQDEARRLGTAPSSSLTVDEAIKITRSIVTSPKTPLAPLEALAEQDDEIHSVLEEASVVGDLQQDELVRERIAKGLRTLTNDNPADAIYAALNDEFSSESLDKIPEQVLELLNVADALIYDDDDFIDTIIEQIRLEKSVEQELNAPSARILSKQRDEIIGTLSDADIFTEE